MKSRFFFLIIKFTRGNSSRSGLMRSSVKFCVSIVAGVVLSCSSTKKAVHQYSVDSKFEVAYSVKFVEDTTSMTMGREDVFNLMIGDNYSYGYSYIDFFKDSLAQTPLGMYTLSQSLLESYETGISFWSSSLGGARLYKNHNEQKLSVIDNISTYRFIYEEDIIPQSWIIQEDTVTIAGYSSQKAVCHWRGRDWVAWFTTELPISEGPWKFHGLPGLIVRLYDTKHHYEFELVSFKKNNATIDIQPLHTGEIRQLIFKYALTKIDRKTFLGMKFGERGHIIREADMARIGLTADWVELKYGYIELDY